MTDRLPPVDRWPATDPTDPTNPKDPTDRLSTADTTALPPTAGRPTGDGGAQDAVARVLYVYAVGRDGQELRDVADAHPAGIALRLVRGDGLGALVSSVPADEFGDQGLRAQLEDLERLEAIARAHHAVVAAAFERTTVLPMRLATVYLDDGRVAGMLGDRGPEFRSLLDRLEGRVEWGVKVYADPAAGRRPDGPPGSDAEATAGAVASAAAAAGGGPGDADGDSAVGRHSAPPVVSRAGRSATAGQAASGGGPGRAYLQRRRAQRDTRQQAHRAAGSVAERIAEVAGTRAAGAVTHRPQQGDLATGPGENVANHAYLVDADRSNEFQATLQDVVRDVPGVRLELTGPWAPYSFATPPSASPGGPDAR